MTTTRTQAAARRREEACAAAMFADRVRRTRVLDYTQRAAVRAALEVRLYRETVGLSRNLQVERDAAIAAAMENAPAHGIFF